MADEVEKAGAGWRVEPTSDGIAEGLSKVLASRMELTTKGLAARSFVEHEYSWEHIANRTLDKYIASIS
jgi:glycosyltransferase involved in cell wall biosynthesis